MDGMLSQEEINALLNEPGVSDIGEQPLTDAEKDAIGEVANISMGTAATALFSLVNKKVDISTPVVSFATWEDIVAAYERPCVFIRIGYTVGLDGSNVLVLKEHDVKVITDLMMGGDGTNTQEELGEMHLSAICEAMNQMMGSAATSLSSMLNKMMGASATSLATMLGKMIDISPPEADVVDLAEAFDGGSIDSFLAGQFVRITFRMEIGDLVDSQIMQLYPFSFAKEMYSNISKNMEIEADTIADQQVAAPSGAQSQPQPAPAAAAPMMGQPAAAPMPGAPMMGQPMMAQPVMAQPVNVQPAQFQAFAQNISPALQSENIDLIMDVPLDVTVELGRTSKSIQEILDFVPGTIIELNKIAGEPIDVLVNGKYVAKGEVVVIEENFGIRITEIIK